MFVVVLHARYLRDAVKYARLLIVGSMALFALTSLYGRFSYYLIPAFVLPFLEFIVRFRWPALGVTIRAFLLGITLAFAHAFCLAFVQSGVAGLARLAVNFQYVSLMTMGLGVGSIIFAKDILVNNE